MAQSGVTRFSTEPSERMCFAPGLLFTASCGKEAGRRPAHPGQKCGWIESATSPRVKVRRGWPTLYRIRKDSDYEFSEENCTEARHCPDTKGRQAGFEDMSAMMKRAKWRG